MKLKVGDKVLVTTGKDKGKTGTVVKVDPKLERVVVEGVNKYVKHIKPVAGRAGDKVLVERYLATAKVAILNEKNQPDRIGYQVAKDGSKVRVFKKTGTVITEKKESKK
ncbi:MAG: 50S ribosomal protein L24 [Patescibacteria group bacterium]|nr:MAG: 50S ribosomal protein L24 [Patescibacteria group bacterium]